MSSVESIKDQRELPPWLKSFFSTKMKTLASVLDNLSSFGKLQEILILTLEATLSDAFKPGYLYSSF